MTRVSEIRFDPCPSALFETNVHTGPVSLYTQLLFGTFRDWHID